MRKTLHAAAITAVLGMLVLAGPGVRANEGVEVMFLGDMPWAGQTGILVAKALTPLAKSDGSEIDLRRDSGNGTGRTEDGTNQGIVVMDGAKTDGGSWYCRLLDASGIGDVVDVSLLCD